MSRLINSLALTTLVCVLGNSALQAQDPWGCQSCGPNASFAQRFHTDYYRNVRWPTPFRAMDSSSVLAYLEVQRNNGWKLHNTLGAAMYDRNTNTLTDSGRAHVRWIVSRAPRDRRVVFVLQGKNQEITAKRLESAQLAISEFVPVGPLPTIYLTDEDAPGSSGVYQTAINRAMTTTVPDPRLPDANFTSSGGGGAEGGN